MTPCIHQRMLWNIETNTPWEGRYKTSNPYTYGKTIHRLWNNDGETGGHVLLWFDGSGLYGRPQAQEFVVVLKGLVVDGDGWNVDDINVRIWNKSKSVIRPYPDNTSDFCRVFTKHRYLQKGHKEGVKFAKNKMQIFFSSQVISESKAVLRRRS